MVETPVETIDDTTTTTTVATTGGGDKEAAAASRQRALLDKEDDDTEYTVRYLFPKYPPFPPKKKTFFISDVVEQKTSYFANMIDGFNELLCLIDDARLLIQYLCNHDRQLFFDVSDYSQYASMPLIFMARDKCRIRRAYTAATITSQKATKRIWRIAAQGMLTNSTISLMGILANLGQTEAKAVTYVLNEMFRKWLHVYLHEEHNFLIREVNYRYWIYHFKRDSPWLALAFINLLEQ